MLLKFVAQTAILSTLLILAYGQCRASTLSSTQPLASQWEESIDCDPADYVDAAGLQTALPQECEPVENACDADEAD